MPLQTDVAISKIQNASNPFAKIYQYFHLILRKRVKNRPLGCALIPHLSRQTLLS
jgi:hypothetical protein